MPRDAATPRATSKDVAREAGVSQPTVSRVFSKTARVAPALRARVLEAAERLDYRPNRLARAMSRGRSRVIGLVVAYLDNPFYAEAIDRFARAFQARGYHLVLVTASNDEDDVDRLVRDILDLQVDGIVLASVAADLSLTEAIARAGVPLVLFNRGQTAGAVPTVTAPNLDGGRQAALYLARLGHRRIAHVSGWQGSKTGRDRQQGFLAGMEEAGLDPVACIDSRYDRDRARAATMALFDGPTPPDAIFAGNDHMAFAVIETLRHDLGLDVPRDVSVLGYDDVKLAAWRSFDLTTFRQPANRMVEATVEMLLALVAGDAVETIQVEIPSDLIERGTVRDRTSQACPTPR